MQYLKLFTNALLALLLTMQALPAQEDLDVPVIVIPDYPVINVETSAGNFQMELNGVKAPLTVRNFLQYVESGHYKNTVFHRVVPGFVVQGGGFDTSYQKKSTLGVIPNEAGNGLSNRRGTVAMARTSEPHSADAQFYINLGDNMALDPRPTRWGYAVFGKVIEGMDAIDQMGYAATGPGPVPELVKDVPTEAIVILNMTLLEEPEEEPALPDAQPE